MPSTHVLNDLPLNMTSSSKAPVLKVQDLSISAHEQLLVEQVSFTLNAGETLAIVGESGSGKTLTAMSLLGLLPPGLNFHGKIWLGSDLLPQPMDGLDYEQIYRQIRGQRVAVIFQEPMTALNPLHKIGKQLTEALRLTGFDHQQAMEKAGQLMEQVGLPSGKDFLKRYPHQLSGGQRQRVMIAMALALDPEVLVADEPTTALDVSLQSQILDLLLKIQKERGLALILISHNLPLVRRYSEQIMVMKKGKIEEYGPTESIFINPNSDYTRQLLSHDHGAAVPLAVDSPIRLNIQKLSVSYTEKRLLKKSKVSTILHDIDLAVKKGECVGVVGESGSGKSTLAAAILRLISSKGSIEFNHQQLQGLSERKIRPLRPQLQLILQDPFSSLDPRFNIHQIISEGLDQTKLDLTEKSKRIENVLKQVELSSEVLTRYPHQLSGGQRQRVAIARALVLEPDLLILDEPTSALDHTTQTQVIDLLRKIQQNTGISYIFISHDLNVIKSLCHSLFVLKSGRVVENGPIEQVLSTPRHIYTKELIAYLSYL